MPARHRFHQAARTFTVCFFLASSTVGAEVLYQWKEADGSVTFSPTPPPSESGIEFKVMDTAANSASDISLPDNNASASSFAELSRQNQRAQATATIPVVPEQQLSYAPTARFVAGQRGDLPEGISRATPDALNTTNGASLSTSASQPQTSAHSEGAQVSKSKSSHCADLGKRITALEYRISHSTSNLEMDQVILQISRYQKSYTTHCN